MPIVRISGKIKGQKDKERGLRAKLLYILFNSGWDISNTNGDETISLMGVQNKILAADAFLFPPYAGIEDIFQLSSIIVGKQTFDIALKNKPAIIFDPNNSWEKFIKLFNYLKENGTIAASLESYVKFTKDPKEIITILDSYYTLKTTVNEIEERNFLKAQKPLKEKNDGKKIPLKNICVFCSSSVSHKNYLDFAYEIGKKIASKGYGCVTGAGSSGMMGMVVKGANENSGYTFGCNIPRLTALEGVPDEINHFLPASDIYSRIEVMIKPSNEFWVLPGGIGTLQELLALILLKQQNSPLMRGKTIKIINFKVNKWLNFWHHLEKIDKGIKDYVQFIDFKDL